MRIDDWLQQFRRGAFVRQLEDWFHQLRNRGLQHWLVAVALIFLGTQIKDWLDEQYAWLSVRYRLYQVFEEIGHRRPRTSTVMVLVEDEEYWTGEPAGRAPFKRTYLAKLVRALDAADPAVIALDFDLRSPTPDWSLVVHPDYEKETREFLETVKSVSRNRTIVLPGAVDLGRDEDSALESNVFDNFNFDDGMVRLGYILLPYDARRIPPLRLKLKNGAEIDSFATAIVRAFDPKVLESIPEDSEPYGSFLRPEKFSRYSATHVLSTDPKTLKSEVGCKIVIVGGAWQSRAVGRGGEIDAYPTPVGSISGALNHANYVEAILDSRVYRPWGRGIELAIELSLSVLVAIVLALGYRPITRILVIAGLLMSLVAFSYLSWQNLGLFFDSYIPIVLLGGHAVVEQILSWRDDAHKWQAAEHAKY